MKQSFRSLALLVLAVATLHAAEPAKPDTAPAVEMVRPLAPALQIIFKRTGGGLTCTATNVPGFVIAGSDRKFFPANARIIGETIRLTSPEVPVPIAARYSAPTNAALRGQTGEPVTAFRTDDWPVP